MKVDAMVRIKSLNEVLEIEGVKDYRDVGGPGIVDYMLECFGKEGLVISCHNENENCVVSFDGDDWEFKKEWLEPAGVPTVEEIVTTLENDVDLYYKIKNEEEAIRFANELLSRGYLRNVQEFVERFESGQDCLIIYDVLKDYDLSGEDEAIRADSVKYEPTSVEEIKTPTTVDDSKHLFIDAKDLLTGGRISLDVSEGCEAVKAPTYKTNADRHRDLINHIHEVYVEKNMKYGDSFNDTIKKYGFISALTRMHDKFSRIESFILNGYEDSEESLIDSLLDLSNYCLMTVMEIDSKERVDK